MEEKIRRIVTERTLEIGNAKMVEGDEAYIRFKLEPLVRDIKESKNEYWMYATLGELNDDTAWFVFPGRKKTGLLLIPEAIVEISDKCPAADPQVFWVQFLIRAEDVNEK